MTETSTATASLYLDTSDPANAVWAYRVHYADDSEESGSVADVGARALADLDAGYAPHPADLESLRDYLDAMTNPGLDWQFYDSGEQCVGSLWPQD